MVGSLLMTTATSVSETRVLTGRRAKLRSWCHARIVDAPVSLTTVWVFVLFSTVTVAIFSMQQLFYDNHYLIVTSLEVLQCKSYFKVASILELLPYSYCTVHPAILQLLFYSHYTTVEFLCYSYHATCFILKLQQLIHYILYTTVNILHVI